VTMSQRFSVRLTISSGTMPSSNDRRSGFEGCSANCASRHEQKEVKRQPTDEQKADGDAGDDERAGWPIAQRLCRLVRSNRSRDVIGRVRGVVRFVGRHRDHSFDCAV
jgi:hypothetical protein